MRVEIRHTTHLAYDADVVEGVMDVRLGPFSDADQRWESYDLRVSPSASVRAMGQLQARLRHSAVDEILEEGLEPYLADIQHRIHTASECVTAGYLRDEPQPGRLVAVARAAMIMAAQQQQQQRVIE